MNPREIFKTHKDWFGGDLTYSHNPETGGSYVWNVRIGMNTIIKIMSGSEYSGKIYSDKENSSFDIIVISIRYVECNQPVQGIIQCHHICVPYYLVLEFICIYRNT